MRHPSKNFVICILTLPFCVTAYAQSPNGLPGRVLQLERNQRELMAALVDTTRVLEQHRALQTQAFDFQRKQQAHSARFGTSLTDVMARLKTLEESRKVRLPAQRPVVSPGHNSDQLDALAARIRALEDRTERLHTTTARPAPIEDYATAMARRELARSQAMVDTNRRNEIVVTDPRYATMASRFSRLTANRQNHSPARSLRHSTPIDDQEGGMIEPCCGLD